MAKPWVSVILPVYNGARYVRAAIRSILTQTFREFELLIIDDGSTDQTPAILAQFTDPRMRVCTNPRNYGIPKTRNIGIRQARGAYLAWQDADDLSEPQRLQLQLQQMRAQPGLAALGTAHCTIDARGRKTRHKPRLSTPAVQDLLQRNCFINGSVMLRADAVAAAGGYDEFFKLSEDYELFLRLAKRFSLGNLPARLYQLRVHADSTTARAARQNVYYAEIARALHRGQIQPRALAEFAELDWQSYQARLNRADRIQFNLRLAAANKRTKNYRAALQDYRRVQSLDGDSFTVRKNILKMKWKIGWNKIRRGG